MGYVTIASAGVAGGVTVEVTARDWPDHTAVHRAACAVTMSAAAEAPTPHALLARKISEVALVSGQFRLRSGATSSEYFDQFLLAARPALLREVAEHLAPLLPADYDALAGLELGGILIAQALSQVTGRSTRFIRREAKAYGTGRRFEGGDITARRLVLIEDIVTTGAHLLEIVRSLRAAGAMVGDVLCVLDLQSGARRALEPEGVGLKALFTTHDLQG